jgi:PAS domain S-box-containing protein
LNQIKILLIEDNPADARLIKESLRDALDNFHLEWKEGLSSGLAYLAKTDVDAILVDLNLPDSQGLETFTKINEIFSEKPIIVLTGLNDRELAYRAVREGAQDYLVKDEVDGRLLDRCIRYSIERKKSETALREAEQAKQVAQARNAQYEQAVSMISDIVWRYDVNTKGEHVGSYISPVADRMLGLPVGTIGNSFDKYFSYVHPDDLPSVQEMLSEGIRTPGKEKTAEYRLRKADGTTFLVLSKGSAYGRFSVYGTTSDITERKRVEEALHESEEMFRTIFENNSAAMAIIERDTTISKVNKEYCNLGLFEEKDVIGISWTSHIPPEDLGRLLEYNRNRLIDPKSAPDKYEFMFYRKDGKIRHCLMSVAMIPTSQQIVCSFTDITERMRAEEELRRTNASLDSIIENIPNMIFLKDARELRFVRFNRAGEDLLGNFRDDLLGKNDYDFFPKEQADFFTEKDREVLHRKKVVDIPEEPIQTRNKGERILHTKKVPILNEKGEPEYLLGISEDITERKQAEEALRENEKRYHSYVYNAPYGVFVADENGKYLQVNPMACKITGYDESELLHMRIPDILPSDMNDCGFRHFLEVQANGYASSEISFLTSAP